MRPYLSSSATREQGGCGFVGQGRPCFEQRPFVVMNDEAFVDLGLVPGEPDGAQDVD